MQCKCCRILFCAVLHAVGSYFVQCNAEAFYFVQCNAAAFYFVQMQCCSILFCAVQCCSILFIPILWLCPKNSWMTKRLSNERTSSVSIISHTFTIYTDSNSTPSLTWHQRHTTCGFAQLAYFSLFYLRKKAEHWKASIYSFYLLDCFTGSLAV